MGGISAPYRSSSIQSLVLLPSLHPHALLLLLVRSLRIDRTTFKSSRTGNLRGRLRLGWIRCGRPRRPLPEALSAGENRATAVLHTVAPPPDDYRPWRLRESLELLPFARAPSRLSRGLEDRPDRELVRHASVEPTSPCQSRLLHVCLSAGVAQQQGTGPVLVLDCLPDCMCIGKRLWSLSLCHLRILSDSAFVGSVADLH